MLFQQQACTDQLAALAWKIVGGGSAFQKPHTDHRRLATGALRRKKLASIHWLSGLADSPNVGVRPPEVPPPLGTPVVQAEHGMRACAAPQVRLVVPGRQVVPACVSRERPVGDLIVLVP